jgi:HAD domain in Swiss Army Knife RNA repair proteins
VLHPFGRRHRHPLFQGFHGAPDAKRLADVLAPFPAVRIEINSSRREGRTPDELRQILPRRLSWCVIGMTPVLPLASGADVAGSRYREMDLYLGQYPAAQHWFTLDDDTRLLPPGLPNLSAAFRQVWAVITTRNPVSFPRSFSFPL